MQHSANLTTGESDKSFYFIGQKHETDKVTHHGYHRFYPRFIDQFKDFDGGAVLEIGIDRMQSLQTWLEYFQTAFVYGIDKGIQDEGPRHKIFKADQSEKETLNTIIETGIRHPVFLICDDGSHVPEHQLNSFDLLFEKLLVPGGVYIIEDVETSYWTKGDIYGYPTRYGYHHPASIVEVFKFMLDELNREFLTESNQNAQDKYLRGQISKKTRGEVGSITFCHNCIIITKKTVEDRVFDNRSYRFGGAL